MKVTGTIKDVSLGLDGKAQVTLTINEKNTLIQGLDELSAAEKLSLEMKPYRAKRSLDSNAYAWVLLDKLSEKLRIPKVTIYREIIKDVGGNNETVCVTNGAVERLCEGWSKNGIGWITETFPSKIEGCTNVILYFGSSTYDTSQMHRFLNLCIELCEENDIDTITPNEKARLLALWERNQ
jgi:hypothetical protein